LLAALINFRPESSITDILKANQMSLQCPEVIAVALYSFEPTQEDEIQLVEGDSMIVIQQQVDDWWLVKNGDLVGLIPSTHVSVVSPKRVTKLNPLPFGWESFTDDESGDVYYFNESTGISESSKLMK
jgi:SH3 domain/WW domain